MMKYSFNWKVISKKPAARTKLLSKKKKKKRLQKTLLGHKKTEVQNIQGAWTFALGELWQTSSSWLAATSLSFCLSPFVPSQASWTGSSSTAKKDRFVHLRTPSPCNSKLSSTWEQVPVGRRSRAGNMTAETLEFREIKPEKEGDRVI